MWMTKVQKIKAIYHTLNFFNLDVTQKCLIAECWCPLSELDRIQMALKRGSEESGSTVPSILNRMETIESPPTYNRTNKYTRGFQNIVDSYGIASYLEINPGLYFFLVNLIYIKIFSSIHYDFISIFICYDVWRSRSWFNYVFSCFVSYIKRKKIRNNS